MKETTRTLIRLQPLFRELFANTVRLHLALLLALPLLVLAACTTGAGRRAVWQSVLDRAQQQNANYDSITNVDSIQLAAGFFDRHGTPNERMRANYLLARAFDDLGEKPAALHYFQKAAENADTAAKDCDYKTLCRVHGHLAYLLLHQSSPLDALEEFDEVDKYSFLCKDTMVQLASLTYRARAYELLNMPDSAISTAKRASETYDRLGHDSLASMAMGAVIDLLIEKGDYYEVKKTFNRYERVNGLFDSKHNIKEGKEIYYYLKGLYHLKNNQMDSAAYLFKKLYRVAKNSNHRECASYGMAQVCQKLGKAEEGLSYAMQAYALNDSTHQEQATSDYQRNQAEYNYSRHQRIAEKESEKLRKTETRLIVTLLTLTIVILAIAIVQLKYRKEQKEAKRREQEQNDRYARLQIAKMELEDINRKYNNGRIALEEQISELKGVLLKVEKEKEEAMQANEREKEEILQHALSSLERRIEDNESEMAELLEEKQEEIELLEAELERFKKKNVILLKSDQYQSIRTAPISIRFFKYGNNELEGKPTSEEWAELRQLISKNIPVFFVKLNSGTQSISDDDEKLCMLVRLQMPMYAIINITGKSKNSISNARRRMLGKIFGKKAGGAQEFDRLLLKL